MFFPDVDRREFLSLLFEQCQQCGLEIRAYYLMTNHVHLVAVPASADSLGRTMRRVNSQWDSYLSRRQGWGVPLGSVARRVKVYHFGAGQTAPPCPIYLYLMAVV